MNALRHRVRIFFADRRTHSCAIATAIFGTLSYLYLFVNNINNNDMIATLPRGYGTGISSGRWMLQLLGALTDRVWGAYNVPLFHGLIALILIALTSAVLVRTLELRNTRLCFGLAAITATAAPIASLMFFQFTVHFYALALLLVAIAAFLLRRGRLLPFLGACILGACSLGIYQAYFPFFAVTLLLMLFGQCLNKKSKIKDLLIFALRCLGALTLSYLLYILALRGCLAILHTELSGYQGINTIGSISLASIPDAYVQFFLLTVKDIYGFSATLFLRCMLLLLLLFCIVALLLAWRDRVSKVVFGIATLLFLPLAANAFLVLTPDSVIYTRMCMGLLAVFYLPVVIADHLIFSNVRFRRFAVSGVAALLLLSAVNYAWQSNGNYQSVYYSNRKAENYFTGMFSRIRALDGYRDGMEVVLIGENISDAAYTDNWLDTPFRYRGRIGAVGQINQYSRPEFLANYLGFSFRQITEEERATYAEEISGMSYYPDSGSIRIADDLILVLLERK